MEVTLQEREEAAGPYFSPEQNGGEKKCAVSLPPFDGNKKNRDESKANESANDGCRTPGFGNTSPLKSKDEADDCCSNDEGSDKIHLVELFDEWNIGIVVIARGFWRLEGKENYGRRNSPYGKIDVKAEVHSLAIFISWGVLKHSTHSSVVELCGCPNR